ncbi:MAG TPA: hypothetical protein VGW57_12250 [Chthoniobacterales bacterium]|nr:hypothetical protein [Chthoniobacterales bacterium]
MKAKLPRVLRRARPSLAFTAAALLLQVMLAGCDNDNKTAETSPVPATTPSPAASAPAEKTTATPNANATATIPFKLEVVEVANSAMPAVHSYASATADGKWLIIGGRNVGLHGFNRDNNNFPTSAQNTVAYVIDPGANKVLGSVDLVKTLTSQLAGPLSATSAESVQLGNNLYVVGGYGTDLESPGKITTFGSIIKIDVAGLINAILTDPSKIPQFFAQIPKPDHLLQVTGGDMKAFQNMFFLAYGQAFTGFYSVENKDYNRAGGQFQKYNETVRVFTLKPDLSIDTLQNDDGPYDDSLPYHRRDLNVVDIIQADGVTPAIVVYGGVFRAGQVAGLTNPIDIAFPTPGPSPSPGSIPSLPPPVVQKSFQQGLNHYDCANLTIFDQASSSSFTTLLGGISQYHYDPQTNTLIQDQVDLANGGIDGLPFINSVSTIQHLPTPGAFAQFIQPTPLPGLVGTGARFLFNPAVQAAGAMFENGVFKLAGLSGRTLVGHMVGGIESFGPYSGLVTQNPSTIASTRLFEIWVTPGPSSVIPMPPIPTSTTPYPPGKKPSATAQPTATP